MSNVPGARLNSPSRSQPSVSSVDTGSDMGAVATRRMLQVVGVVIVDPAMHRTRVNAEIVEREFEAELALTGSHPPATGTRVRAHEHTFRVIFGDTDKMGIVYYANYLRYFEAGRSELMRAAQYPYTALEAAGYGLPVVEAKVKYHGPAHYDEALTLETRVEALKFASIRITYRLVRQNNGELVATGETLHACVGPKGNVTRLPDALRTSLDG